jgi:hypothetical protein
MHKAFCYDCLNGRHYLGDIYLDGTVILKLVLKKYMKAWNGCVRSGWDAVARRGVMNTEDFGLLGFDDAPSMGKWLQTVQTNTTLEAKCDTFLRNIGNSLRSDAASFPTHRNP